jgi:hypothetical protein
VNPGWLAAGVFGVVLLTSKKSGAILQPHFDHPLPSTPPIPPITIPPQGRHLSPEEKMVLAPYIPKIDLDNAVLWWNTPPSSFTSEDPKLYVMALTTPKGIFLRGPNHAITSPHEFSILGHELIHVGQQRQGLVHGGDTPALEVPAYQMEVRILADLDGQASAWEKPS